MNGPSLPARRQRSAALLASLACLAMAGASATARAEQPAAHDRPAAHDAPHVNPHAGLREPEGGGEHGEGTGAHAEHDESGPPADINWFHGLIGEKQGVPPSLLWRAPGEPPPFLASVLNFALLVGLIVRFGRKPLSDALTKRKSTILHDIEESQRMRTAAEKRLGEYEDRLARMNEELERVRKEFREQGERDKERIVREATERRDRMLQDAGLLLAQEAKDLRQVVLAELVEDATRKAADILSKQMTLGDHDRFAEAVLADVRGRAASRTPSSFGPPRGSVS